GVDRRRLPVDDLAEIVRELDPAGRRPGREVGRDADPEDEVAARGQALEDEALLDRLRREIPSLEDAAAAELDAVAVDRGLRVRIEGDRLASGVEALDRERDRVVPRRVGPEERDVRRPLAPEARLPARAVDPDPAVAGAADEDPGAVDGRRAEAPRDCGRSG